MNSLSQEPSTVKQELPVYYCHTAGHEVIPVRVERHDGVVWFYCSDPVHTYDGKRELDCHVASFERRAR